MMLYVHLNQYKSPQLSISIKQFIYSVHLTQNLNSLQSFLFLHFYLKLQNLVSKSQWKVILYRHQLYFLQVLYIINCFFIFSFQASYFPFFHLKWQFPLSKYHYISIMKKKIAKQRNESFICEELEKNHQIYKRVVKSIANNHLRRSQHDRVVSTINEQMKRPQTSYSLKKDFKELKRLVKCSQHMQTSQEKSNNCYQRIATFHHFEKPHQKIHFSLQKQIKKSAQTAKMKKYQGLKFNHFNNSLGKIFKTSNRLMDRKNRQQNSNTSQCSSSKRIPAENINNSVEPKMSLLGNFSEEQKQNFLKKLKKFLDREHLDGFGKSQNLRNYLINHFFLQQFLEKSTTDLGMLHKKQENKNVYRRIKSEMIGQLIQETKFYKILDKILMHELKKKTSQKEIVRKNSNIFFQTKAKQKDSNKYFQKLYENAAEKIDNAFHEFNQKKEERKKSKPLKRKILKTYF